MCFRALLYAVSHSIRIGFEGSKLKIVDQKASDCRVSQIGFQFLRWLQVRAALADEADAGAAGVERALHVRALEPAYSLMKIDQNSINLIVPISSSRVHIE